MAILYGDSLLTDWMIGLYNKSTRMRHSSDASLDNTKNNMEKKPYLRLDKRSIGALAHARSSRRRLPAKQNRRLNSVLKRMWGCSSVVERSIRIRDARGSIPLISISFFNLGGDDLLQKPRKKV